MTEFAVLIKECALVDDIIGLFDGVAFHSESTSETMEQHAMYYHYHGDTMVNNIVSYGADGKVYLCGLNFLGSRHNCSHLFPVICNNIGSFKICVDQGFPKSGDADGIFVRPFSKGLLVVYCLSSNLISSVFQIHMLPYLLCLSNSYTSLRQASECSMHGLQGT